MTSIASPCSSCKHFDNAIKDRNVCKAFPEGVPTEIIWGSHGHRSPFKGDHGFRWEPVKGMGFMGKAFEEFLANEFLVNDDDDV